MEPSVSRMRRERYDAFAMGSASFGDAGHDRGDDNYYCALTLTGPNTILALPTHPYISQLLAPSDSHKTLELEPPSEISKKCVQEIAF